VKEALPDHVSNTGDVGCQRISGDGCGPSVQRIVMFIFLKPCGSVDRKIGSGCEGFGVPGRFVRKLCFLNVERILEAFDFTVIIAYLCPQVVNEAGKVREGI
jgi:hypothetical protein